ncbi:MAG: OB-fold nucleic acid binding domain-containing protein, partial [Clostridiales bacterium]|nr:OB-fold nucleic acid binding domain-containing protein [Clostridiales bacterium]
MSDANKVNTEKTAEELNELLQIRRDKLSNLQSMNKDPFHIVKAEVTHHSTEIKNNFEALEGETVAVAGRLMSKRVMGKASFIDVQDRDGHIQCYITRDDVGGAEFYNTIFKKMIDIGDIISVKGFVFKTKMGE